MNTDEILKEVTRGAVDVVGRDDLAKKLSSGKRLRIKFGADPSSPDLHLGHSVVMSKLRRFQDLGHTAVLIIGDFTAQVGDPSGRDLTRPVLDHETVAKNAKTYTEQAFKVLDREKTEIRFNSEWLKPFFASPAVGVSDFVNIAKSVTISRLLEREDFRARMKAETPISLLEILYPILQGYDSVAVKADVELGGQDQIFNLLMGRDLQKLHAQEPQAVMTMPLLVGTDGEKKMSKSYGNYVGLNDLPNDMFGKVMSVSDALMYSYYELLTSEDLAAVKAEHPMEAKKRLAGLITARFHDAEQAAAARQHFEQVFSRKELPEDMPVYRAEKAGKLSYLLVAAGLAKGMNEARRLIDQGAVRLDGEKVPEDIVFEPRACVLQVGRRQFRKIEK
ncbi:MAG: tyrosine--tRNA ligase [Elusimicrobia bacterium GWA2_64_40]|nr:MAG: tyrosine--tRNA ligase [Elusimicrobia bacterium GWA2_64_40]OGR66806.1 MAG: tyrosine--tRNA ligase [Elusimicrobia bacterium GWB2_63_16]HAN04830.1 tyrosine--tRNA ligase [Elusimicrobiota bacterium]